MVERQTCTWTGASGAKYVYDVYPRHPAITPNEPGNYIYAKMDQHRRWVPVCIGEGNLTQRAGIDPDAVEWIDAKGATSVHLHVNYDRDDRLAEVKDLLDNFPQAYVPDVCSEKQRG